MRRCPVFLVVGVVLLSTAGAVLAQETAPPPANPPPQLERPRIDPAKEAAIRRLTEMTGNRDEFVQVLRQMDVQIRQMLEQDLPPDPRSRELFNRIMDKTI